MHHCLLIPEIFSRILDSMFQLEELWKDGFVEEKDHAVLNKTLASLAQTCRTFTSPALDRLWRHLDHIDPLIKIMPNCMWEAPEAKDYSQSELHAMMREEHLLRFNAYAARVQFLVGFCDEISPFTQKNVITAIANFPGASLPLLPNLTEFLSGDIEIEIDYRVMPLYILKYLTGPALTMFAYYGCLSDLGPAWDAFEDIARPIPNVTMATFNLLPDTIVKEESDSIGNIVTQWQNLQVLHSCALFQETMDELASRQTLHTLSVELNDYSYQWSYKRLPPTVRTFSLCVNDTPNCTEFLKKLEGNLTTLRLQFLCDYSENSEIDDLFCTLASRMDTTQLENLTIEPRSFFSTKNHPILLTRLHLSYLEAFSVLVSLDLSEFDTGTLDDAAYRQAAGAFPQLKSLKLGMGPTTEKPAASVGTVIAVLRSCTHLRTLYISFDGSIPPPPMTGLEDHTQHCHGEEEGAGKGKTGGTVTSRVGAWGASNRYLTTICVGYSPIGEDAEGWKRLAWCLKSVMPRLREIESACDDHAESWLAVERLLVLENDANPTVDILGSS